MLRHLLLTALILSAFHLSPLPAKSLPDFTGAPPNSNTGTLLFSPDSLNPTQVTATDALNNTWTALFDGHQNVTSVAGPLNLSSSYSYSADGKDLVAATGADGLTWRFNYGENGNSAHALTSLLDPTGLTLLELGYNSYGQVTGANVPATATASGVDQTATATYDVKTGDLTSLTNPVGDVATVNQYDGLGDPLVYSLYPDTGNPATSTTPLTGTLTWNAAQEVTQETMPNGVQSSDAWNSHQLTAIQSAAPAQAGGALLSRMTFDHDSRGRLYHAADLVGTAAGYRYDKDSNLTRILDGNGNSTAFSYGANGEPTGVQWPDGNSRMATYDAGGRLSSATDERGVVSTTLFNQIDQLTDQQFPNSPADNIHLDYDSLHRPVAATDKSGVRSCQYDPTTGWVNSVTTTLAGLSQGTNTYTVSYTYYANGARKSMTSPLGTTSYQYNAAGELTSLTNPFGETTSWTYDHIGRVTAQSTTTATGTVLANNYSYGPSGQAGDTSTAPIFLSNIQQSVNGQPFWNYSLTHSYLGQLLQQVGTGGAGGSETEAYQYDPRGRLVTEAEQGTVDSQHSFSYSGAYQYDLSNNLSPVVPGGSGTTGGTTGTSGSTTGYPSSSSTTGYPSSSGSTTGYPSSGSTTGYPSSSSSELSTLRLADYLPKESHNDEAVHPASNFESMSTSIAGDTHPHDRLAQSGYPGGGYPGGGTSGYPGGGSSTGTGAWTYNPDNQLTSANGGLGGLPAPSGMSYDPSGKLTSLNGMTLSYDTWGNMTSVSGAPAGTVSFTYDSSGRRVSKTANGQTTYYLYDGDVVLAEVDGSGNLKAAYTWGAQGLISDRVQGGTTSRFYEFDAVGSTRALLDSHGNLLASEAYTAWGSPLGPPLNTPFGWTGRWGNYNDAETGLVLMEARYYAPSMGRFLNRDPKGYSGGINLYNYCGGDPINYVDPSGLDILGQSEGFWAGGAVAAVIVCTGGLAAPVVLGAIAAGAITGTLVDHFGGGKPWGESIFNGTGGAIAGVPAGAMALTYCAWRAAGMGVFAALGFAVNGFSPIVESEAPQEIDAIAPQALYRRNLGGVTGGGTGGEATGGGTGGGTGGATGGETHLPLGRAEGSLAQPRMVSRLLSSGVSPKNLIRIQNPANDMVPMMDSAGQIHFNLQDTSPSFMADSSRFTAQEWDWISQNSYLWPKVTVYNVPGGISVPARVSVGPDF